MRKMLKASSLLICVLEQRLWFIVYKINRVW